MSAKTGVRMVPTLFVVAALGAAAYIFWPGNPPGTESNSDRDVHLQVTFDPPHVQDKVLIYIEVNTVPFDVDGTFDSPWDRTISVPPGQVVRLHADFRRPGVITCKVWGPGRDLAMISLPGPNLAKCRSAGL